MRSERMVCLAAAAAAAAALATASAQAYTHPQYLLVNKAYGYAVPDAWNQDFPQSVTQASIDNITNTLGGVGSASRRLGVSFQFNCLDPNVNASLTTLSEILSLSLANDLPVAITLDAFEFWNWRVSLALRRPPGGGVGVQPAPLHPFANRTSGRPGHSMNP
jgi:hypothetical protein